jgi:ketosteroid isomerase-like protein
MMLTYAAGHDLLEALVEARIRCDGDRLTDRFTDDAQVFPDPFATPLAGHNDLRAYLLSAAERQGAFDLAIERHWVSGDTLLAAWHASWTRRSDDAKIRQAGFLSAEVGGDGRIARLRLWSVTREHLAG